MYAPTKPVRFLHFRLFAAAPVLVLIAGCATVSPDGGFNAVETVASERLNKTVKWSRSEEDRKAIQQNVNVLLQQPLTADNAAQIALLNNRGLQAAYAELGIAQADLVQAGRLLNPVLGIAGWHHQEGTKSIVGIESSLLGLLLTSSSTEFERMRFAHTQLRAAEAVVKLATDTRKTYYRAVAAEQQVDYYRQVMSAAEAAAELASRMANVGNMSKRDQAREQVFYAEAIVKLARAKQMAIRERERLTRLLGLWGNDTQFKLPPTLPDLPKIRPVFMGLEAAAIEQRFDIQAAKKEAETIAKGLGLTKATRFINVLNLGVESEKEPGERRLTGPTLKLEIPLFDFGGARIARYEAQYRQSVDRLAETAINARSEVREAYSGYVLAYDTAKHYRDEITPLRKKISDQNLLFYNGMLISVFELLTDAREQVASVVEYIDALKEFWVTEAELEHAVGGKLPLSVSSDSASAITPATQTKPGDAELNLHQHHNEGK